MNVIEVIPLVRGTVIETLTYYTAAEYPTGSILSVPIRNQKRRAIVISSAPVSTAKTALRAATFTLRKLPPQPIVAAIPPQIIATAEALTATVPAGMGSILHALLPKEVMSGEVALQQNNAKSDAEEPAHVYVLQGTYEDRFRAYRSRIRETFAHRGSVLFIVPTSADLERAKAHLERGIESRIITFSSSFTKHRLAKAYEEFQDLSHSKLIIATPSHAILDRHDITEIIVDQSRSRAYKSRFRPYLDIREAIKVMGRLSERTVVLGDLLPRTEDEYLRQQDIYLTEEEAPKRVQFNDTFTVITHAPERTASSAFKLFSPELEKVIKRAHGERSNMFLYAARRGIAPVVACVDCGYIFRCPDSGAPYTLFKTIKDGEERRWFLASASGKRIRAADTCSACGSWRLRERGIGIQHIAEELREAFPQIPVFLFDHTTATSFRRAKSIIGNFYDSKGGILLGTAMALPYLETPVGYSIVTSLDAARAVPTWRADEELFSLLLTLREKTNQETILQTRTEPDELLEYVKTGNLEQFYNEEIALRQQLSYPPFSFFVHLTLTGDAASVAVTEEEVAKLLATYKPRFYHAPTTTSEKATRYGLIRVPQQTWPDRRLMDLLRTIPPHVRIEINPDRLV